MAAGTLANLSMSGFVRTPPQIAKQIMSNILSFSPTAKYITVLDPTCGDGDLLFPTWEFPNVWRYGVEISAERANKARRLLADRQTSIVTTAIETVSLPKKSLSAVVANPPYIFQNGKRAEYRIIADTGEALMPGGVMVAIIPARSAWRADMIEHWCKWYDHIQVWKFPDRKSEQDESTFEDYTQICVIGVRRGEPTTTSTASLKKQLSAYRCHKVEKTEAYTWEGTPPPDLPTAPLSHRYTVPEAQMLPELVVRKADDATLLNALGQIWNDDRPKPAEWITATCWQEENQIESPAMPYTGPAHIAAKVMTNVLGGTVIYGPEPTGENARPHIFVAFVDREWESKKLDQEEKEKLYKEGVVSVRVKQSQDRPVLGILDIEQGKWTYHEGDEVFKFLQPWLSTLAQKVVEQHQPLYALDPEDWQIRLMTEFATDKQLPKAPYPGLAPAQQHRVFAMAKALAHRRVSAIQGEPGTGKTRIATGIMAIMAYEWRHRAGQFHSRRRQPAWARRLRKTWLAHPETRSWLQLEAVYNEQGKTIAYHHLPSGKMLAPESAGPCALPLLVATPKRVTKEYIHEIQQAWPQAKAIPLESHRDIVSWLQLCATTTTAPAVIGVISHSLTRAFGRDWQPALYTKSVVTESNELEPDPTLLPQLDPVYNNDEELIGYRYKGTQAFLRRSETNTRFHCPDCYGEILAVPGADKEEDPLKGGGKHEEEQVGVLASVREKELKDRGMPVESRTWFELKPRWCSCKEDPRNSGQSRPRVRAPLWAASRIAVTQKKYPQLPFATWSSIMETLRQQAAQTTEQDHLLLLASRPSVLERYVTAVCADSALHAPLQELVARYSPAREANEPLPKTLLALLRRHHIVREQVIRLAPNAIAWQPLFFRLLMEAVQQGYSSWRALLEPTYTLSRSRGKTGKTHKSDLHGLCLMEQPGTGAIPQTVRDLDIVQGCQVIRDPVSGAPLAYHRMGKHSTQPEEVYTPRYLQVGNKRKLVGYQAQSTGQVVMRTLTYGFRMPPKDSFSPYDYLARFYPGCVALSVIDESHNGRKKDTDIARAHHQAMRAACSRLLTSGTHYGGDILAFFYYWFRFKPRFWRTLGYSWKDVAAALQRYGVIEQWITERESDARRGSGQTTTTESTIAAPGLSAKLIPHLLVDMGYLTVRDVGAFMPDKIEIPEIVRMQDDSLTPARDRLDELKQEEQQHKEALHALQKELDYATRLTDDGLDDGHRSLELERHIQEKTEQLEAIRLACQDQQDWIDARDLLGSYVSIVRHLEELSRKRNTAARMAKGTIPKLFSSLPCQSTFEVWQTERTTWGDKGKRSRIIQTPTLEWNHLYPMEVKLREIVEKERQEGRRVMIYVEQTDQRSMPARLAWVLKDYQTWSLPANIEAEDRQQAILDAVAAGNHILLVPYRKVSEGLNLQSAVDTIIWYEMAINLFMLDQASRRAWRLGKQEEVRIYYLVYAGSTAHSKLRKLGNQSGAAAAFAGEPAKGALIEHAGADQTTLARLSASLESEAEEEEEEDLLGQLIQEDDTQDLKAAFAQRALEEREALKQGRHWYGAVDTLPERLAAMFEQREQHPSSIWDDLPSLRLAFPQLPASKPATVPAPLPLSQDVEEQRNEAVVQPTASRSPATPTQPPATKPVFPSKPPVQHQPKGAPSTRVERNQAADGDAEVAETQHIVLIFGDIDQIARLKSRKKNTKVKKKAAKTEVQDIPEMKEQQPSKQRGGEPAAVYALSLFDIIDTETQTPTQSTPVPTPTKPHQQQMTLW